MKKPQWLKDTTAEHYDGLQRVRHYIKRPKGKTRELFVCWCVRGRKKGEYWRSGEIRFCMN